MPVESSAIARSIRLWPATLSIATPPAGVSFTLLPERVKLPAVAVKVTLSNAVPAVKLLLVDVGVAPANTSLSPATGARSSDQLAAVIQLWSEPPPPSQVRVWLIVYVCSDVIPVLGLKALAAMS